MQLQGTVPVLTQLDIENFQSLHALSLKLGRFTVITGATGSGKSSVFRAAELLAFNARGVSYITRGAKSCKVAAGDQEQGWAAGIERGVARGKDAYRFSHRPQGGGEPHTETWTKLGGEVPEQIQAVLQMSGLNFHDQFSQPFLLDSSGGEVARVLGKLTNVTLLFNAAREADRRRKEIMGDLRRAEASLAGLTEAAQKFRGMKDRQAAAEEAGQALVRAQEIEEKLTRLRSLAARTEAAEAALKRSMPPEVPSTERLDELSGQLNRARSLYATLDSAVLAAEGARFAIGEAAKTEQAAHERLHDVLTAAGQCPTCGQAVA
jgi:DNA repair exonuclease SbcCD ATPase subunit